MRRKNERTAEKPIAHRRASRKESVHMPFKSEEQRRYMWANHPKIAREWTEKHGSRPQKEVKSSNKSTGSKKK